MFSIYLFNNNTDFIFKMLIIKSQLQAKHMMSLCYQRSNSSTEIFPFTIPRKKWALLIGCDGVKEYNQGRVQCPL